MQIHEIFAAGGLIAKKHPQYEPRRGQVTMANAVADALSSKHVLVAQAGTGLGKTFAYLVPSVIFALREKKKVVISTRTINLQEQIFKKDIPFLQAALGPEWQFVAVLAKGRGNFLCRRKIDNLRSLDRGILTDKRQVDALREIQALVFEKVLKVGDREELPLHPSSELWTLVAGDGDTCLRRMCPYVDICYYFASRRAQAKANIIVVNHSLFFADIAIRKEDDFAAEKAVLEDYAAVVFDEAHHLEEVATDFFSYSVSMARVRLATVAVLASLRPGGMLASPFFASRLGHIEAATQKVMQEAQQLFATLGEPRRLYEQDKQDNPLHPSLLAFAEAVRDLLGGDNSEEQDAYVTLLAERLRRINSDFDFILTRQGGEEKYAYWIEANHSEIVLVAAPVSLQEELREQVFRRIDTVILSSATLSARLLKRIGVDKCRLLRLDSPFDYANNSLLYLPRDTVEPSDSPLYDEYVARQTAEIVAITEGRALVLFTSYKAMHNVFERLGHLRELGFTLLRQGDENRGVILEKFKKGHRMILFAVASYWEGIDVPGEALSCVIVARLPFSVPTEPIMQARCEAIEREGKSSFNDYSLPQAILRLKQGFGRLIRSATDKGVVAILDNRLQKKAYGKMFLQELPPARFTNDLEEVRKLLS